MQRAQPDLPQTIVVARLGDAAEILNSCASNGNYLAHAPGHALDELRTSVFSLIGAAEPAEISNLKEALLNYICSTVVERCGVSAQNSQEAAKSILFDVHRATTAEQEQDSALASLPASRAERAETRLIMELIADLNGRGFVDSSAYSPKRHAARLFAQIDSYFASWMETCGDKSFVVDAEAGQGGPLRFVSDRKGDSRIFRAYYSVRCAEGSVACFGNQFSIYPRGEVEVRREPTTLVTLSLKLPRAEIKSLPQDMQTAGTLESDVLYSPEAFRMARAALLESGIPADEKGLQAHLIETIRGAVSRQLPAQVQHGEGVADASKVTVYSISKLRGHDDNTLFADTSLGPCRVDLYIWFPESSQESRRYSTESPYIVRCSVVKTAEQ